MSTVLKNWKTTLLGIIAGGLMAASAAYKPGMTWKDWAAAAVVALLGAIAHDGHS